MPGSPEVAYQIADRREETRHFRRTSECEAIRAAVARLLASAPAAATSHLRAHRTTPVWHHQREA